MSARPEPTSDEGRAQVPRITRRAAMAASLLLFGCAATRPAGLRRAHEGAPPEVVARYQRPGPVPPGRIEVIARRPRLHTLEVTVPARFGPDAPKEARRPLSMRWWRPHPEGPRRPLVLISPILEGDLLLVADLAVDLATRGFHAVVLRRARPDVDTSRPVTQVEERLAADVSAQVQALDWLLTHPDVDPERVASLGISAGGIQCAMVAGVDPRYRAHVIALAGGPLADVIVASEEPSLRALVSQGERHVGASGGDLRALLARTIVTDPVALGRYVRPERVLLVLATKDRSVPTSSGQRLREALGSPETVEIPLGHRAAILALPLLRARIHAFLYAHLGRPPP